MNRWGVIIRFAIIGGLWLFFCVWLIVRMQATGTPMTLLNLLPIAISGLIVFIPLYKKYVRKGNNGSDTPRGGR